MTVINNNYNYSLKHGLQYVSDEVAAATVIQRAFRKCRFTQEASKGATSEQVAQLHIKMNDWSEQGFSRYPRMPLVSRSITTEKCGQVMSSDFPELHSSHNPIVSPEAITHVTFDAFKRKLGDVVDEFLQHLMSLPESERGYVLVVDEREKSNSWALSLCLDKLAAHPPVDVIYKDDLSKVYQNPKVKHVAFMDDASYSGSQLKGAIDQCSLLFPVMPQLKGVHVLVPFCSHAAKDKILNVLENEESLQGKIFFPCSNSIHTIRDLPDASNGIIDEAHVFQFVQQISSKYQGSDVHLSADKVPNLHLFSFDHKIPDALSVVTPLMESLLGTIIPPYKAEFDAVLNEHSMQLEAGLRVDLFPEIGPQLSEAAVLVRKGETLYLATKSNLENDVAIQRNGMDLPLLSCEMFPILPNDVVAVEGVGHFHFDGNKIV